MGFIKPFDVEDLVDIPQIESSESEDDAPPLSARSQRARARKIKKSLKDDCSPQRPIVGKRRARRQENDLYLISLAADEGPRKPDSLIQNRGTRGVAHLMRNESAMQGWRKFMKYPEAVQNRILRKQTPQPPKYTKAEQLTSEETPDVLLRYMTYKERKFLLRSNIPLGLVEYLEYAIYRFFVWDYPYHVYYFDPCSSFERKIIHLLAKFYRLQSITRDYGGRHVVLHDKPRKFYGSRTTWLFEYLQNQRSLGSGNNLK